MIPRMYSLLCNLVTLRRKVSAKGSKGKLCKPGTEVFCLYFSALVKRVLYYTENATQAAVV
jgi:hypothetical protein